MCGQHVCGVSRNPHSLAGMIFCLDLELKMSLSLSRNTLSWHFLCASVVYELAACAPQRPTEPSTYCLAQVASMALTQAVGLEAPVLTLSGFSPCLYTRLAQSYRKLMRLEESAGEG